MMKISNSNKSELPAMTFPEADRKYPRRKTNNFAAGVKLRSRDISGGGGTPNRRRSRPETPLLNWKFNEDVNDDAESDLDRKCSRNIASARKLAAGLIRQKLPEVNYSETLGFQASRFDAPFHCHHRSKIYDTLINDPVQSPRSVFGPTNINFYKLDSSLQFSHFAMEGATKWDPVGWTTAVAIKKMFGHQRVPDISSLEAELECARARVNQLETERESSKKKLDQFLKKLGEEKAAWRSREHEKIRAIMEDTRADYSRERKNRKRLEIVNSNLVNELADAKLSAKRILHSYEKERRARGLIEEVCDELAKELGEDKAEVEELKRESLKFTEEVDEERKMLQMAEVWREERVQMKLVDAKVMLEEKYSEMNRLIGELKSFLTFKDMKLDVEKIKRADQLQEAAASLDLRDIREFTYEPPNPDEIFSIFKDFRFDEPNEKEIQQCIAYSPASDDNFHGHSRAYVNLSDNLEDEGSDWETVTHLDEQGSSYSPEGSISSVGKNFLLSNVLQSGADWEGVYCDGTPVSEISEVCSGPVRQASKLWKSSPSNGENFKIKLLEGTNGRLSDGRLSNGAIHSPDHGSSNGGYSPSDLGQQWSPLDSGKMKGCSEWPHNSQKKNLKAKLLQARTETESQKILLRQVLKQKI